MMVRSWLAVWVAGLIFPAISVAQSLQNIEASFQDGRVSISYDLVGAAPEQVFALELYGSHDNFTAPLTHVTGDIGNEITAGTGRKIEWDAAAALGVYNGAITFKIKGTPMVMPFVFTSPVEATAVRRGKQITIEWQGGRKDDDVRVDLYREEQQITSLAQVKNTGTYTWNLPPDLDKGKYHFRLTSGVASVRSDVFRVRARVPLALKVLPVLAIGGVVMFLGSDGGSGGEPPVTSNPNDLPGPPGPE